MTDFPQADSRLLDALRKEMKWHVGYAHRIDRPILVVRIFGKYSQSNDRKVRDALSELPVVWNDGYFIPANDQEAQAYISAMRSRQAAIGKRLRVLDEYLTAQREPVQVEQMSWVEVN